MCDETEVIVTSDASGLLWNVCIWDSRTGTSLMTYKGGGVPAPNSVSFLGNDYLLAGEKSRPLIHVWPVNNQEILHQQLGRIVCPGSVTALATSPTNSHCVAGINEKLYVWEIASGRLMAVAARHYRTVTCIKFTDDGSHFISAGHDGMILVWPIAYLISHYSDELLLQSEAGQSDPRYIFSDHSLPVGDLFVGHGGMRAMLLSVSGDRTCKVYDLAMGALLLSVVFDSALSAVTMDATEMHIFVGTVNGAIHHFTLANPPRTREYHPLKDELGDTFTGHTKAVTCLSTSIDGIRLLSGSNDETVVLWDIQSKLRLRTLQHKGPVTNAFFTILSKQVFSDSFKPSILLQGFKRNLEVNRDEMYTLVVMNKEKQDKNVGSCENNVQSVQNHKSGLEDEILSLKSVNQDLYKFAMEKVLGC